MTAAACGSPPSKRLFIEAETTTEASTELEQEIQQIVDSIQVE